MLFNLLGAQPAIRRDVTARLINKDANRALALKFGKEYFDGTREQGYGGYVYDGRWRPVAQRLADRYRLGPGARVLDVGCGKGFLMKDLQDMLPGVEVIGLDISEYAIAHCHPDVQGRIVRGSCERLPFADRSFAAAISINTIHNLDNSGCRQALRELQRVALPGNTFVQVDAYRDDEELELFEAWMLTAKTYHKPDAWMSLFEEIDYVGDYFWTILEPETTV